MEFRIKNPSLDKHSCELLVIRCYDFRFRKYDQLFVEKFLKILDFDLTAIPAPAKKLIEDTRIRKMLLNDIKNICQKLHHIKKVLLLGHWDCGGYGGSKNFSHPFLEEKTYLVDLKKAKKLFQKALPDLEILIGLSRVEKNILKYRLF